MEQLSQAGRPILWNVDTPLDITFFYLVFFISSAVFICGLYRRFLLWRAGKPAPDRLNCWSERMRSFMDFAILQHGVLRERLPGVFHWLIFWGFAALFFTTTMVFVHQDLGLPVFQGHFYLFLTALSDVLGLGLLVGVVIAAWRRYRRRPDFLHENLSAPLVLMLLALMVLQGFLIEGLRIARLGDPWKFYSPLGYLTSLAFVGLNEQTLSLTHWATWWFHSLTVFLFIALLPYTKFLHMFSSSSNLFFRNLHRPKGAMPYPGDIEQIMERALESETVQVPLGISTVSDLTWKQRLDLDACTECGRCQSVCPAYNADKPLSPKWMILDTRDHLLALRAKGVLPEEDGASAVLAAVDRGLLTKLALPLARFGFPPSVGRTYRGKNEAVRNSALQVGVSAEARIGSEVQEANVFWSCTTCRACMEVCPVAIEHLDIIGEVRRALTMLDGELPVEAQAGLRAIETRGNPYGPQAARADWTKGLNVRELSAGDDIDVLYWVGCVSAYDKRKQNVARSMTRILNASGLTWGIFGSRESCTGDPARRLGDENLFQAQAKKNIELINSITCRTIVANCPHCFNTIRHEYHHVAPFLEGRDVNVVHHSEFIARLIEENRLKLKTGETALYTYHDPCYLGRYNDTYREPRRLLKVVTGQEPLEMAECREKAMCCGAGGGHFWMDLKLGKRINVIRAVQAEKTGAEKVATGCPFCMQMLEDGLKENDAKLEVLDVAEVVASALESTVP